MLAQKPKFNTVYTH